MVYFLKFFFIFFIPTYSSHTAQIITYNKTTTRQIQVVITNHYDKDQNYLGSYSHLDGQYTYHGHKIKNGQYLKLNDLKIHKNKNISAPIIGVNGKPIKSVNKDGDEINSRAYVHFNDQYKFAVYDEEIIPFYPEAISTMFCNHYNREGKFIGVFGINGNFEKEDPLIEPVLYSKKDLLEKCLPAFAIGGASLFASVCVYLYGHHTMSYAMLENAATIKQQHKFIEALNNTYYQLMDGKQKETIGELLSLLNQTKKMFIDKNLRIDDFYHSINDLLQELNTNDNFTIVRDIASTLKNSTNIVEEAYSLISPISNLFNTSNIVIIDRIEHIKQYFSFSNFALCAEADYSNMENCSAPLYEVIPDHKEKMLKWADPVPWEEREPPPEPLPEPYDPCAAPPWPNFGY